MSAPTRQDFILKGQAAAFANEARPRPHAGSWQREAFLEGYDAAMVIRNDVEDKKKHAPPLQKYCHSIRNRLQHLGWSQWDQGARTHVIALTDTLEKERDEKRANRIHRKILAMMGKHGIQPESKVVACEST